MSEQPSTKRSVPSERIASAAVRKALRHIEQHFTSPVCTRELAKLVGLSTGHFCRAFKRWTGMRVSHYVARLRMGLATRSLLASNEAIGRIAVSCGYCSITQFNRVFRKSLQTTPTAYRARRRARR